MSDIFISYATENRQRAVQIAQALAGQGWSVFWDRTTPPGKTWREFIGKELEDARCIVVVWSEVSIGSRWVCEEADEGNRRRILVPAFIENVRPPFGFRSLQAADLSEWDGNLTDAAFPDLAFFALNRAYFWTLWLPRAGLRPLRRQVVSPAVFARRAP